MVESSVSEVLFISISHSITLMGKVWLIVMIFLRVLILLFAGYPLYQDEQERFVCNTIQPGCANVCYDLFSPVSLFRFWLVQLVTLCLPHVIFVIYVIHKVSSALSVALNSTGQAQAFQLFKVHKEQFNKMCVNKVPVAVEQRGGLRYFTGAYILHLLFRTLLEAGFGAAHYYMFGFYIPRRFLCQHAPCTTQVDCYISRPTEKTVMLNFMLAVAALSLFFNFLDFIWAVKRSLKHNTKRKMMVEKIFEEERCFRSAGVASTCRDPSTSTTQQDTEAQLEKTESFSKRHGSGEKFHSSPKASTLGHCSHPCSSEPPCCNSGHNDILISQEEVLERNGSEVALCPQTIGTPRPIRVSKHSRLKPPPPPRLDLKQPSGELVAPVKDVSMTTSVCTRRVGQYSLFELGNGVEPQSGEGGQEKRSEWV